MCMMTVFFSRLQERPSLSVIRDDIVIKKNCVCICIQRVLWLHSQQRPRPHEYIHTYIHIYIHTYQMVLRLELIPRFMCIFLKKNICVQPSMNISVLEQGFRLQSINNTSRGDVPGNDRTQTSVSCFYVSHFPVGGGWGKPRVKSSCIQSFQSFSP